MFTGSNLSVSEEELILLLQQKNRKGFALLYDRYAPALYGVVLKIVRTEEVAQDVLQDSFVKIWKKMEAYNADKGTLFTWILNIARNTAIDKVRSATYRQDMMKTSLEIGSSEANTHQKIEHIGLGKLINQLKPEYREVIEIIYFQGYTHTEAAEALQLPLGTVKTRIKTAIRELRKLT